MALLDDSKIASRCSSSWQLAYDHGGNIPQIRGKLMLRKAKYRQGNDLLLEAVSEPLSQQLILKA